MKRMFERGEGIKAGIRGFKINASNLAAFVAASVFGLTGALVLYANVATAANRWRGGIMDDERNRAWLRRHDFSLPLFAVGSNTPPLGAGRFITSSRLSLCLRCPRS
jgi:hypothetical protein